MMAEPGSAPSERIVREDDLDNENYQVRELFAQFGLAVQTAKTLEKDLVNVATTAKDNEDPHTTQRAYDAIFETELISDLQSGLATRNRLAHSFFWEHAADFMNVFARTNASRALSRH